MHGSLPRWLGFALMALSPACVLPMSVGDEPSGGSSSDGGSTTVASTGSTGDGPSGSADDGSTNGTDESTSSTGGPVFPEQCSTYLKDCPEGYKCMPLIPEDSSVWDGTTACVPVVEDPGGPGDPCSYSDLNAGLETCDATSICFDVDPKTLEGTCYEMCGNSEQDPTCENECSTCVLTGDGVFSWCQDSCDPMAQDCGEGLSCVPYSNGITETFLCRFTLPDAAAAGEACLGFHDCMPGLLCLGEALVPGCTDLNCCAPMCDPEEGIDPCPGLLAGTVCTPWFDPGEGPPKMCTGGPPGICTAA